jgi:hypothetical protein
MEKAVELTPDLPRFCRYVQEHPRNGIVGDIRNYDRLDAQLMFDRMLEVARADVEQLLGGQTTQAPDPGKKLW